MSTMSLTAIQEWMTTSLNSPVSIWCDDPETHKEKIAGGLGGKSFLSYRVSCKQGGRDVVAVRHRYSEFETMRTELKERYHPFGILVPALPPKNQISSMTNTIIAGSKMIDLPFVKERTFGLTMFCENIASIPWLKHDSTWRSFLLPSSQLNFSNIYNTAEESTQSENVGEQRLNTLLQQLAVPYEYSMAQKMDELREEITLVEKHSKFLLEKVRNVQSAQRSLHSAQEQMKSAFSAWSDVERLHLKSLAGKAFNEYENVLRTEEQTTSSFTALATLLQAREDCEAHSGDYIGLTLIAILEQQMSVVEAFRELFQWHDATVKEVDNLQNKINKLESGTAIISFVSSNTSEQLAEAKRIHTEKKSQLTLFYKGIVYFTVPMMARIRAGTLRRLNAIYASCCMSESFNAYKACVDFFQSVDLSAKLVNDVAAKLCEGVSLQPVAKLPDAVYAGIAFSQLQQLEQHEQYQQQQAAVDPSIYDNMGFLSKDTEGMRGLFERSCTISRSKGGGGFPVLPSATVSSSSASTASATVTPANPPQTTHLFTSTVNANTSLSQASNNNTTNNNNQSPLASPNPLTNKRSSAVRNKNQLSSESTDKGDEDNNNHYDDHSRESEGELYDHFDAEAPISSSNNKDDDEDFAMPYRPSAFTFQSAYAVTEPKENGAKFDVDVDAMTGKNEVFGGEKAASLLDSLLGSPSSPAKKSTAVAAKPAPPSAPKPAAEPVAEPVTAAVEEVSVEVKEEVQEPVVAAEAETEPVDETAVEEVSIESEAV